MAAAHAVLETYELLEWTLLHLPLQDLLLAERVCKTWQQVVQKSDRVNKALFRKAAPCNVDFSMPGLALPVRTDYEPYWKEVEPPACYLNPFLDKQVDCLRRVLQLRQTLFESDEKSDIQSVEASWRQMLLLQPPPSSMTFLCKERLNTVERLDSDCLKHMSEWSGHQGRQTNIGQISDFLDEHLQKCPNCPTRRERACKEEQRVPAWSMCVLEDPVRLDLDMTGLECLEKLEGSKEAKDRVIPADSQET